MGHCKKTLPEDKSIADPALLAESNAKRNRSAIIAALRSGESVQDVAARYKVDADVIRKIDGASRL